MTRITEILNCPFCGQEAELILRGNDWTKRRSAEIKCNKCNVIMIVGAIHGTLDWCTKKVIEKWNKRCPPKKEEKKPLYSDFGTDNTELI